MSGDFAPRNLRDQWGLKRSVVEVACVGAGVGLVDACGCAWAATVDVAVVAGSGVLAGAACTSSF